GLETAVFPDWGSVFGGGCFPCGAGVGCGLFRRLDVLPFVRRTCVTDRPIGQSKSVWLVPATGTSPALLGDLDEAERDQLADGGRDRISVDSVFDKLIVCDDQLSVVLAAVLVKLDLDAGENPVSALSERSVCRRLQHLDEPRRERTVDLVVAMVAPVAHDSISA